MFLGDSMIFWLFGALFTVAVGTSLVSIRRIHLQVNWALPDDKKVDFSPWPNSAKEFLLRTYLRGHWWNLLYLHQTHYPASSLRKVLFIAMASTIPALIGMIISGR